MGRPTVRQLEYLVAVAETLHFGRAARRCGVSQPALSAQVQQVEELLGAQLFERSRRRVIVTPLGERLVEKARSALREVDGLQDLARGAARPLTGPLRLGVIPTVAPYLLPASLPAVRRACPELRLLLREDRTGPLVQRLQEGGLDLLFLALPLDAPELEELPLVDEPFLLVMPEQHPLARRRGPVREAELQDEEVLLLEDGHCLRAQALQVCQRAGLRQAGRIQATSLGTLVQMVANGLGVTLLPQSAVPVEVRQDAGLAVRSFRAPTPVRSLGLAWRRGSARAAEFRELGALLRRETAATLRRARRPVSRDRSPRSPLD